MRRIALAFMLAAAPAAAQTPQDVPVPATYQLRVAGPVYFPNGDVKGDPLVVPFGKFGEAIRVEVGTGPTLCDLKAPVRVTSAGSGEPPDQAVAQAEANQRAVLARGLAANSAEVRLAEAQVLQARQRKLLRAGGSPGWIIEVRPLREENGALVIEVGWPRSPLGFSKWNFAPGSVQTKNVQPLYFRVNAQPQTLTLKPGARVLLDRLPADAQPGAACNAIGMGLEVGIESSRATVVESEVWLVHRKPDGSETSEKQVLRTAAGAPSSYIFPRAMLGHDVYGQVSPAKTDGTLDVQLAIGRSGNTEGSQMTFIGPVSLDNTSDTGPFVTMTRVAVRSDTPAEVLSLPLARIRVQDAKAAAKGEHEFSLRIRSKQLTTNK
jgi:hypothetical protein